jgi:hypothetical protein
LCLARGAAYGLNLKIKNLHITYVMAASQAARRSSSAHTSVIRPEITILPTLARVRPVSATLTIRNGFAAGFKEKLLLGLVERA